KAQAENGRARFLIVIAQQLLTDAGPALLRLPADALPPGWRDWQRVYLGEADATPLFALDAPEAAREHFRAHGAFGEVRALATQLPAMDAALAAHARAVLHWHALNLYCGACGGEMTSATAGHARRCVDAGCAVNEIFPRIDPAV